MLRKMAIHQRVSGISPRGLLGMLPFLLWHLETSCLARRLPRIADRINRGTHSPPASRIRAGVAGAVASNGSWHFVMNAALAVPSRHHMVSRSSSGMSCSSGARTVGLSFFSPFEAGPRPKQGSCSANSSISPSKGAVMSLCRASTDHGLRTTVPKPCDASRSDVLHLPFSTA